MLYANDEIFNVSYNADADRLEIKNKGKGKIRKAISEHKIIATAGIMFVLFSLMNCLLIYNFMELLKNV